jgi:hypothetical protein
LAGSVSSQAQTDRFFGAVARMVPIAEFFAPENLGQIMGRGRQRAHSWILAGGNH